MKKRLSIQNILSQILLVFLAVIVIYPLLFVFMTSFKSNFDVITHPFTINTFEPDNYVQAWEIGRIGKYFVNSVLITFVTLAIQLVIIVLASYSLGKLKPWGTGFLTILYLSGLFVTSEMITVPNFTTMRNWGISGTRLALVLPYVANGIAMATFIMTNYVRQMPKELDEAALMDGCGLFQNLTRTAGLDAAVDVQQSVHVFYQERFGHEMGDGGDVAKQQVAVLFMVETCAFEVLAVFGKALVRSDAERLAWRTAMEYAWKVPWDALCFQPCDDFFRMVHVAVIRRRPDDQVCPVLAQRLAKDGIDFHIGKVFKPGLSEAKV